MASPRHWDWRRRSIAEVVWPSFLAAALATLLFFALIDPLPLSLALEIDFDGSPMTVYSIGFFFFWAISALSSLLTAWLIRTERRRADFPRDPD